MTVFVLGYPDEMGGASVELFATVQLWRARGLEVAMLPVWKVRPVWRKRLDDIGCKTLTNVNGHPLLVMPQTADAQLVLPRGSTVVAFGNFHLLQLADQFHAQDCRLVYVPCMSTPCLEDIRFHEAGKQCDKYVFQSSFQFTQYAHLLAEVPDTRCHPIHGAFDPTEFPFAPRPHAPGDPFWAGRISRPDLRKFSPQLWDAYRPVPNVRARIMAWSGPIGRHCGEPPVWATVLKKRAEPAVEFFQHLHAVIHPTGESPENWPRFVLEAMAAGVPVITDNHGGVREMLHDGQTGFLCDSPEQMAEVATELANNEPYRLQIARAARERVAELSDPDVIWAGWKKVFEETTE